MNSQIKEMSQRLAMLRESQGFSPEKIADVLEIPLTEYLQYEAGESDFSFSFIYNAAQVLGVDVLDIISGESPKLSTCTVVRNGGGYEIDRRKAYNYKHLAFTFRNKKAEPFMVTVEPNDSIPNRHSHEGQEFNYIVQGNIEFYIADMVYELGKGDSVYFDATVPHAIRAHGNEPAALLAVVVK
ncbi:helix-turn-helix transcriptional regulator [Tissierella creatinini]|nr:helix-turn-helix transcriptional regulator [Tissierella creatinini]TJX61382.1 helix-turn-helix transcriptional regulator [Soehngenia saccharolytica]